MFFSVPIMVLFWQNNGLSLTQVMLLESIFSIFTIILEIPSGYLSDLYNRKKILIFSSFCGLVSMFIYTFAHDFYQILLAEVFFALFISFSSGTNSAFLYDTLQNLNQEKDFPKIWGNAIFYGMIGLALSNILGGFIASYDLRYTFYASIPFFGFSILILASMKEPKRIKLNIKENYLNELLKTVKNVFTKSKKLKWLLIFSGAIFSLNQSILWLYQPYFKISGLDIVYFGVVFASFQLVAAFSSKYAYKIEQKLGQKKSLISLIFITGVSYLLMSHFIYLFSFLFCFLQQFVRGFRKTIINGYINQLATSDIRATILSIDSFISRAIYALIIPIFGWIADVYSLPQALMVMGVTSLATGSIFLLMLHKNKVL